MRFASGDEDFRAQLFDEFGDDVFENFSNIANALKKRLAEWGNDEEEEDEEDTPPKRVAREEKKEAA